MADISIFPSPFLHNHIAGSIVPMYGSLCLERLIRKVGIASEYYIRAEVNTQFVFQSCSHIDFGKNTKTFFFNASVTASASSQLPVTVLKMIRHNFIFYLLQKW